MANSQVRATRTHLTSRSEQRSTACWKPQMPWGKMGGGGKPSTCWNGLNRVLPNREVERRLLQLRYDAFERLERSSSPPPWPRGVSALVPPGCPPEISSTDLNSGIFTNAILEAGSLLVRGLIPPATVNKLVAGIERSFAASDAAENGSLSVDDAPWFEEFQPASSQKKWSPRFPKFLRSGGGVYAADSPPVFFDLIEAVEEAGITALVTAHLGERPALSVKKTVLRRVTHESSNASWHQDGAFMGTNIRTVNLWLALTRCGDDAPGLDILPRRLNYIVETGTTGAIFDWAASPAKVWRRQVKGWESVGPCSRRATPCSSTICSCIGPLPSPA